MRWGVRHALPAAFLERGARRGEAIARLLRNAQVRDQALSERFPDLRVAGTPVRRDLQTLRGFERLPVVLRQGPQRPLWAILAPDVSRRRA